MGKVKMYLDNLPRWESGANKGQINWKNSVGYMVKAEYEGVMYSFKILKNDKGYLYVEVDGIKKEKPIRYGQFKEGNIEYLIGIKTYEYRYCIGEIIKDKKRDLTILEQIKIRYRNGKITRGYRCCCNKDGYKYDVSEYNLKKGRGCPICSNNKIMLGVNTIWDTDKWVVDMGLISEEDAKKYTRGSRKRINMACPNCGHSKNIAIYNIINNKANCCTVCGDGVSYPEKFMNSVLRQIKIEFETQKVFKWAKDKRYDFYIPNMNMIIETHGIQHYKESGFKDINLKEEQENDILKKELALKNGIKKYIIIDCRKSDKYFIKKNIENELNNIFNLNNINWNECQEFALKSLVKEVCEYWNNKKEYESASDLTKYFYLDRNTITGYLKKGSELGWCNYNAKEELRKRSMRNNTKRRRRVAVYKDGKFIGEYLSVTELIERAKQDFGVKFNTANISAVCNGKQKTHKGYTFKYLE